jgi:hypothetical protein
MKTNRNFNMFADFKALELEVPTICLVTGCVSGRRDRRYNFTYLCNLATLNSPSTVLICTHPTLLIRMTSRYMSSHV